MASVRSAGVLSYGMKKRQPPCQPLPTWPYSSLLNPKAPISTMKTVSLQGLQRLLSSQWMVSAVGQ
ncbi:hypothetical protein LEMLEM_LOCUS80, partial [Lemmus lemmus]